MDQLFVLVKSTGRFWSLLRSLSGKRPSSSPNQPISFTHKLHSKLTDISRAFCKQFTGTEPRVRHANSRNLARHFKQSHPLDHNFAPFTAGSVQETIKSSGNSTAVGPENVNILFLKYFGPIAINFLALFNLSIANADVPSIWKMATIIPIPKPGKSPSEGASYRPISLLCPAVKILERLVLPYLTSHLDLADTQHGFRVLHSTKTALLPLVDRIARGFNQPKPLLRTVSLGVDFSRAFDTVSHDLLINIIGSSNLPHNIVRWIASYLKGRAAAVLYQGTTSPYRPLRAGVPQGSVISPSLFNFYVSDYPHSSELTTSYADDFTVAVSFSDVCTASNHIEQHAQDLENWTVTKALQISIDETHSTLFTLDTHQSNYSPQISIGQSPISLDRRLKYLGVVFDTRLTFIPHIRYISDRCTSHLKLLAAWAGTRWGQQKETLVIT